MLITILGDTFIAKAKFEERELLKSAGFDWRADIKAWTTKNAKVASRLRKFADSDAKTKIDRSLISVMPWTGGIPYPEGLTPKNFQIEVAAPWALARNFSYLALDPGLGKTIVEALIINALANRPIVIINQPGLCLNTESELQKWCTNRFPGNINVYPYSHFDHRSAPVLIVPDSLISDPLGARSDLYQRLDQMTALGDAVLFVDEAQRFNNLESQRTKAMIKIASRFEKVVFMSGTPLRNDRLMELYPILSNFAPETIDFMSEGQYGHRYCDAYFDRFGHYHADGATDSEYLFKRIKEKFMLRITKAEALPELPAKTREIVFLGEAAPRQITRFEKKHLAEFSPEDLTKAKITKSPHLSTYRRLLGRYKLPLSVAFIKEVLESGDEYMLVFAEHIDTVKGLCEKLKKYNPLVVTGKTSAKAKQKAVDAFQAGESRIFIGNTQACGLGFTLTRASRVIHVEPGWVPADSDQATDRAHRIGQMQNVLEQSLCFRNSLDRKLLERSIEKREIIKQL